MNIIDIYTDSPNGYDITKNEPKTKDIEKVIRYYLDCLDSYFPQKYPLEYAICNYALGVALFGDRNIKQDLAVNTNLERSKRIENALYYFNTSLEVFAAKDYPIMHCLVNLYMAKLFRERSLLTVNRSFLADRSSPEESLQYGIDHALEALDILSLSRPHQAELALCCLELGHLFLLQSEQVERADDVILKEQALTYLERCLAISGKLSDSLLCIGPRGEPIHWRPDTPSTFPPHVRDLLEGNAFSFLEGCAYYLLGRLEAAWGMMELADHFSDTRSGRLTQANPHHTLAFEHFCRCVRPKYLDQTHPLWSDAHHRVALLIIKHPVIVDADFAEARDVTAVSDIYLDSALSHLLLALRCPNLSKTSIMDIHFHVAQAYISKLQLVIDKVPYGQSITKAVAASDGLEVIKAIDKHLNEALSRVTAANTQSAQDAYLYFFSCLKLAEYRMLEAAAVPNMTAATREEHLRDAVEYIVDACVSRPLPDNMDLHYIASCQLGQVLVAVKRQHAASKAYAKILFCLSALLNRSLFNAHVIENKLRDDLYKHTSQAVAAALKEVRWIKLHLGPTRLHERVSPGYATWSFEEIASARYRLQKTDSDHMLDLNNHKSELDEHVSALVVTKASPPKGIPPLKLPNQAFKKVYLSGEDIADHVIHKTSDASVMQSLEAEQGGGAAGGAMTSSQTVAHFKPPSGGVPLSALGHVIPSEAFDGDSLTSADKKRVEQEILEGRRPLLSPYTHRLRARVPPLTQMTQIDKANRVAYGLGKGKVVHLIPNKALRDKDKMTSSDQSTSTSSTFKDKRKLILPPKNDPAAPNNKKKQLEEVREEEEKEGEQDDEEDNDDEEIEEEEEKEKKSNNNNSMNDFDENDRYKRRKNSNNTNNNNNSKSSNTNNNDTKNQRKNEAEDEDEELEDKESEKLVLTRPRSQKIIRFAEPDNNTSPPPPNHTPGEEESKSDDNKRRGKGGGLWAGMFGKKSKPKPSSEGEGQRSSSKPRKLPKPWLLTLFPAKKGRAAASLPKMKLDTSAWKEEKLGDVVGFWASKQTYYLFMLHTRQSRMELLIKCKSLHVIAGERVNNLLYHAKPAYRARFIQLRQQLMEDCNKLLTSSPNSLKELSQLSMSDLQVLFRSHSKMIRRLDEFEFFLTYKLSKSDYFLSFILAAPVFTRDIALLDDALLDAQRLTANLDHEKALAQALAQPEEEVPSDPVGPIKVRAGTGASASEAGTRKSRSAHTRVISRDDRSDVVSASAATSASNIFNTGKGRDGLTAEERKQQDEERAEVLAGKMTYSQSTLLDGCHYLRGGQQGAKDMLLRHLGHEECMMLWHLPALPHHHLSVTLVWRENSASEHEFFTSSEAITARRYDESQQQPDAYKRLKEQTTQGKGKGKAGQMTGIVMEVARSDVEASHLLQYIQRYLDALHSQPLAKRMTLVSDALRSVSCALSITELLLMIPLHVTSLVICCPPVMRLLPWHLLLIETFNKPRTQPTHTTPNPTTSNKGEEEVCEEVHLLDKYCVRLGPSLSLFELNCMAGSALRQSVGHHRLVAIDADDHDDLQAIPTLVQDKGFGAGMAGMESVKTKQSSAASVVTQSTMNHTGVTGAAAKKHAKHHHAAGIRGADLEVASVAHIWSADPEDYHVLNNHAASISGLETGVALHENYALYTKFRDEMAQTLRHSDDIDEEEDEAEDGLGLGDSNSVAALDIRATKILRKIRKKRKKNFLFKKKTSNDDNDDEEEEEEKELNEEEEVKEQRRTHQNHVKALTMCRVLHFAAAKTLLNDADVRQRAHPIASVIVPKADPFNFQTTRRRLFTAADVIKKLFLRNCGLAVLSKFGLTDDVIDVASPVIDLNWEFVEAFHLAGATSVMLPLWEGGEQGIGTLAHVLYLLRFYSVLPAKSRHRLSVVETSRRAQLWLRDVTANDAIAFVHKTPIPAKARRLIIEEIESYVSATVRSEGSKATSVKKDSNVAEGEGNRVGGHHKFFTHFLNWGSFLVSGYGGNIHHPDLTPTADVSDETTALFGTHVSDDPNYHKNISSEWNDAELDNIEFEASILRMEGKVAEAVELEKRIRQLKMQRWKNRVKKVKETGWRAGRGFLDTLDYFDKLLLEQDDDVVSVSSDDDSAKEKEKSKRKKQAEEVEEEGVEEGMNVEGSRLQFNDKNTILPATSSALTPSTKLPQSDSAREKPQFRPLDLDKNRKAIYDEWKAKVGDLSMEVKQPTLPTPNKKNTSGPHIKKKDNFDFAMMRSIKSRAEKEEEEEEDDGFLDDYDEDEEEEDDSDDESDDEETGNRADRYRVGKGKKGKGKGKKGLWSVFGEVRSYAEIAQMLSEQYPLKVLDEKIQAFDEKKEKCIIS